MRIVFTRKPKAVKKNIAARKERINQLNGFYMVHTLMWTEQMKARSI